MAGEVKDRVYGAVSRSIEASKHFHWDIPTALATPGIKASKAIELATAAAAASAYTRNLTAPVRQTLNGIGFPHNNGMTFVVKRGGATAVVTCAPDGTPEHLVQQLRKNRPPHKAFDPLALRKVSLACVRAGRGASDTNAQWTVGRLQRR